MSSFVKGLVLLVNCLFCSYVYGDIAILNPENKTVEMFIDYKITYTPPIPDEGIFGLLTLASPPDACSPIKPPPNNKSNWFVLAFRSLSFPTFHCSNREKIQHAASAGYKALILYSPHDFNQNSSIYSPFEITNLSIPAVLVSHEDGESLRSHFLSKYGYILFITSELPPNFSYYLIPFAIVISAVILIIISYLVFQLMMCIMERRKAQRYRLSKKYLKKLTLQKYEKGIYYETCAICLDDYIEGEKIRILPCNHAYHMKCIDPWLTKNRRVCPVCKAKVTLPGMEEYSDSDSDSDATNRRTNASNNDLASETTRLLPSTSTSISRNNRIHSNRANLRSLSLLIDSRPTNNDSNPRSSNANQMLNQQQSTSTRYEILDDSLLQPGPSASAPIVTELSSNNNNNNSRKNQKRKKKRSLTSRSNVQVVVADVSPLMAPPQLSINCDSESERPITPVHNDNYAGPNPQSLHNNITRSNNRSNDNRNNRNGSIDQIV